MSVPIQHEGATHVTVVVSQDSATRAPTVHLRDRFTFQTTEEASRYAEALMAWLADRPGPDVIERPFTGHAPARKRTLEEILQLDNPEFDERARPFDQEAPPALTHEPRRSVA